MGVAKCMGIGHKESGFGKSNGRGKVQILTDKLLPQHLRNLRVRIATGRGNQAHCWRGPQVAKMKNVKTHFELQQTEWNFTNAQDDDEQQNLPIVMELQPAAS